MTPQRARDATHRDILVVTLTLTTGAVDAVSFLHLGKVFSSVITGNLALLGVAAGSANPGLAVSGGVALASYAVGVFAAGAIARTPEPHQPGWPGRVTAALAVELGVLAAFCAGWLATAGRPAGEARLTLLSIAAAAMGMQSAAVRRLGQMSSTYLTSTLTGVIMALSIRERPSELGRSLGVFAAIVVGAVSGAAAGDSAPGWVPAAILIPLAAVVAVPPGCPLIRFAGRLLREPNRQAKRLRNGGTPTAGSARRGT